MKWRENIVKRKEKMGKKEAVNMKKVQEAGKVRLPDQLNHEYKTPASRWWEDIEQ